MLAFKLSFSLVHPIHTFAPQKIALIYHSSLIGTGNRQDLSHICDLSSRSLFNPSFTDIAMLNLNMAKSIRAITGGRPPPSNKRFWRSASDKNMRIRW
jgi:hypothetical protein